MRLWKKRQPANVVHLDDYRCPSCKSKQVRYYHALKVQALNLSMIAGFLIIVTSTLVLGSYGMMWAWMRMVEGKL